MGLDLVRACRATCPTQRTLGLPTSAAALQFLQCRMCKDCPVNEIPPKPWDPPISLQYPTTFRSQVVRVNMLPARNCARKSPSQQVVPRDCSRARSGKITCCSTTQWPSDSASKTDPTGAPAPTYLANSTLETFSQGKVPLASSSCMACHGNAVSLPAEPLRQHRGQQGLQPIGLHVHPGKGTANALTPRAGLSAPT